MALTVAKHTVANFIEKASRLYEQERRPPSDASPLEMYLMRWLQWVGGGLRASSEAMVASKRWGVGSFS